MGRIVNHIPILLLGSVLLNPMPSKVSRANPIPFAIPPVDIVYPEVDNIVEESVSPIPPVKKPLGVPAVDPAGSELTVRGKEVQGVYLPMARVSTRPIRETIRYITTEIRSSAVILDMKDDRGRVTFTNSIQYATTPPHGYYRKMNRLIQAFKSRGIYVIGRIVCFKDNLLARTRPTTAIRDRRTDGIWVDQSGIPWVDPHSEQAHDYIVNIAREAEAIGVDEVQLDYVRFPVEPDARFALFPNRLGKQARYEAIASLLAKVDRAISIPLSIDVFGLTAFNKGDEDGLGQHLDYLAPHVDVISPMLYLANWPKPFWDKPCPSRTYGMVYRAVRQMRRRLGNDIHIRPLLQGFSYRAQNFGHMFLRNQINAALAAGSSGYLFWNQGGRYQKLADVWRQLKISEENAVLSVRQRIQPPLR